MRWLKVVTVLAAAYAVNVVVVAAASGVEFLLASWLEGGNPVTAVLLVETVGELEVVQLNGGGFGVHSKVLCSWIHDGWVGPNSLDFISELLTLGGIAVPSTELTGTALLCTNDENCTEPEVWAAKLPWETEAELMVDGAETFFVDLLFNTGFYVQCLILGITINETCTFATIAIKETNEANGTVDNEFSDAFQLLAGLKLGNCTLGGAEDLEYSGLETTQETGISLSVSSE